MSPSLNPAAERRAGTSGSAAVVLSALPVVDEVVRAGAAGIYEVHPEVSFYYWNGGRPVMRSKKSGCGFLDRYRLVSQAFGDAPDRIRRAIKEADAADDDILDALAALWTATRIQQGTAVRVGQVEERDACGILMQIVG